MIKLQKARELAQSRKVLLDFFATKYKVWGTFLPRRPKLKKWAILYIGGKKNGKYHFWN